MMKKSSAGIVCLTLIGGWASLSVRAATIPEKLHPTEHMHGHSIQISEMYAQDLSE